jgi:glycosyltransferase involved in cell wall biosynthesis
MKKKVIFVNSHPIQYFTPLYKYMNGKGIETACWYCSDESVKGGFDQEFGLNVKWDIPLLEGYSYKFFKNYSLRPSHSNGFFGLINPGMIWQLFKIPKSILVVHGWHYFTLFFLLMAGKICGHTVCLRCDVPYKHEDFKTGWLQKFKRFGLKNILFPQINFFLYIGKQNKMFYESYGIPGTRLLSCPYAVDNERFQKEYSNLLKDIPTIKDRIGIPKSSKVLLFSAKYILKKRPLDILHAFNQLSDKNLWLIMVGEGELRSDMEAFIRAENIDNVILTGFVNQSEISEYYAIGDLFIMCSGLGENWGLSVNEAMNFDLPLILSDLSGCADDLVMEGVNGFTFRTGDVDDLTLKIKQVLIDNALTETTSSIDIIHPYSYDTISRNINTLT